MENVTLDQLKAVPAALLRQALEAVEKKEPVEFVFQIGDEPLTITKYPPLTLGDKKVMKKEPFNLDFRKLKDFNDEEEAMFVLFALQRVRKKTTMEEVDALPIRLVQDIVLHIMVESQSVNTPFSKRSTSSAASTAGASAS